MKSVFDTIISQAMIVSIYGSDRLDINLSVGLGVAALKAFECVIMFFRKPIRVRYVLYQQFSFVVSIFMIIIIGPEVNNLV